MGKVSSIIISLLILALTGYGVFWVFQAGFSWFGNLSSDVAIAIVAGSATVLASTFAIVFGRYFQAERDREAAHRDKKIALYDEFTKRLFDIFYSEENIKKKYDQVPFLREVQRKLILRSGPKVVKTYAKWHQVLASQGDDPTAEAMIGMVDFFLALREDLGLSNRGIERVHLIRFLLKNPDLFMAMYQKNKVVSIKEIAEVEKKLANDSQQNANQNLKKKS